MAESIVPFLGRLANVVVAELGGELVGFVAGRIRSLPPYFGTENIGAISEVFIAEKCRGRGLGRLLLDFALRWFQEQGIRRVELQVVTGNGRAISFYEELGWRPELLQMVWEPRVGTGKE